MRRDVPYGGGPAMDSFVWISICRLVLQGRTRRLSGLHEAARGSVALSAIESWVPWLDRVRLRRCRADYRLTSQVIPALPARARKKSAALLIGRSHARSALNVDTGR